MTDATKTQAVKAQRLAVLFTAAAVAMFWTLLVPLASAQKYSASAALVDNRIAQASASSVDAAAPIAFDRRWYIGGSVGMAVLEPDTVCPCMRVADDSDATVGLFAGFDLNPLLSFEIYAQSLGSAGIEFLGDAVGDVDYQVGGINATAYLFNRVQGNSQVLASSRQGLSAFVKLGIGALRNDSELDYQRDHDVHAMAGGGLEYGWRNGFAARAEVVAYDTDARAVSLSVLKRFGNTRGGDVANVPVLNEPAEPRQPSPEPIDEPKLAAAIELPTIYFEFGKFSLTSDATVELDRFIDAMRREPDLQLLLEGHTDSIDTEAFNQKLSEQRASEVGDYLNQKGISRERLQRRGYGELQPVASNATSAGRSQNRRVEISFR